jgi:cytochrome c peroxidase
MSGSSGPLCVALSGTHELAVLSSPNLQGQTPKTQRLPLGCNPRAVARRPGTGEVWAANHLGNSLSVVTPENRTVRTVELEPPAKLDRRLRGRFLFASAHLARGMRFTCNSCHPDGNTDGLSWRFAHLKDGIDRRNSRNLRSMVLLTSPYRWVGREQDFEDFVNDEIAGFFGTRKLAHNDLHAYWEMVNELPMPPNPYRSADGSLTPAGQRGQALFNGQAGCKSCHAGPQAGGSGKSAWIGTTEKSVKLDVPHLSGAYDSAPYLHDGRAATLEEVFQKQNAAQLHGKAHLLTAEQLRDLLQYVREL